KCMLMTFHDQTPLRRVEEMRADFVANASHELRTPLAALSGFIDTLQGPAREDAKARAVRRSVALAAGRVVGPCPPRRVRRHRPAPAPGRRRARAAGAGAPGGDRDRTPGEPGDDWGGARG